MVQFALKLAICQLFLLAVPSRGQVRGLGKFEEVFAWRQLAYDINGYTVFEDRYSDDDLVGDGGISSKRYSDIILFADDNEEERNWNERPTPAPATTVNPLDEVNRFFVQYNNVPMGVERVGRRLFVTVPRRRYGIPSTLNYIDLSANRNNRSPALMPYPDLQGSRGLVSIYRTRADQCGRLWAVDTGAIEIPNNLQQIQQPAIVVFDLNTDRQIMRYQLTDTDIPATNTPTGLASISVLIMNGDCSDAYAYIADVATYGIIVYSLRENRSWRHTHNYLSFNPTAGNLRSAGQTFQWNDGVFSVALGSEKSDGCATAYFHPMVSTQEFSVSTCALNSKQTDQTAFQLIGERGPNTQSTMHGLHEATGVMFFAEIGRDAISCWNTRRPLTPQNVAVLAQDSDRLSYPSDLHVTGDEVWVMTNRLPRFIYSRLDPRQHNFYIYKANVRDLIAGTVCDGERSQSPSRSTQHGYNGYN